uniref:Chalcone-flavonone isomerase family protein n=1 Tax=Cymbidium hybrid cultivar TaxID=28471 RepID=A0A5A4PVN5_9ASPA|nr:chalcone isomerase 1 [Cymbidium hybrid cultivar]
MAETPATPVEVEGVTFPAEFTSPATSKPLFLGGAGARGIEVGGKFIAVTVIGVYLEAAAIPAIAGKWKGKKAEELAGSVEYYRDIITGSFEKLTRVTMLLPLTGQQYSEKVAENCIAAWKAAGVYTGEEEAAINKFLEIFKPKSFPPGTSIIFTHSPHGSLTIGFLEEGGGPVAATGVVENKKLTNAVLESIIGEKGVSPAAKQSLAQRISEFLNKKEEEEGIWL